MNWINSVVRPKIRSILRKKDMPDNLWVKCPETGQMIYYKDLEANQFVVPGSNFHWRMSAAARLKFLFDEGDYESLSLPEVPVDPLKFRDERRYTDRLKDARSKTSMADAVLAGAGRLEGQRIVAAAQDFDFMGGSLGTAAGEAVIAAMRAAVKRETPFILFAASGGARMQEGILSLMQMPRTTVAVQELREARLPYIVVLTHPTTGGVTASYAMLGDIHIAEPGALIGFAGPRVIEQTIREQLPNGFQRVRISPRPRHGRHGRASPQSARDARPHLPPPDPPTAGSRRRGLRGQGWQARAYGPALDHRAFRQRSRHRRAYRGRRGLDERGRQWR